MKRLIGLLVVAVTIMYPIGVYLWIQHVSAIMFGVVIASVAVIKFSFTDAKTRHEWVLLIGALTCSSLMIISDQQFFVKLYPVLISIFVGGLFNVSLYQEQSLIEKMARLRGKKITPLAKIYTRKLTLVWAILLYVNASIALYLALFASTQAWALYSGLLSYLVMGFFILAEIIYRQYFIAKYDSAG